MVHAEQRLTRCIEGAEASGTRDVLNLVYVVGLERAYGPRARWLAAVCGRRGIGALSVGRSIILLTLCRPGATSPRPLSLIA